MALGRLILAWVVVAIWFGIATFLISYVVARLSVAPGGIIDGAVTTTLLKWRLAEAGLITLIASLWFDSLGTGESWLLFFLIGALATLPTWVGDRRAQLPRRALVAGAVADIIRYLGAGGLLAWRLS